MAFWLVILLVEIALAVVIVILIGVLLILIAIYRDPDDKVPEDIPDDIEPPMVHVVASRDEKPGNIYDFPPVRAA